MGRLTERERAILKQLGVSASGLETMFRIHRGDRITGGMAGVKLEHQGYVTTYQSPGPGRQLTPAGLKLLKSARQLGW